MNSFFTLELAIEFYQISKDLKLPAHLQSQYLRASVNARQSFVFMVGPNLISPKK